MKAFYFILIFLPACLVPKASSPEDKKEPSISFFKAEPPELNEGERVYFSFKTKDVTSCQITAINLAGEKKILFNQLEKISASAGDIPPKDDNNASSNPRLSHIPRGDTKYELLCQPLGSQKERDGDETAPPVMLSSTAEVRVILSDDVLKSDSLFEIALSFDIEKIKGLAISFLGETFGRFDSKITDYNPSLIKEDQRAIDSENAIKPSSGSKMLGSLYPGLSATKVISLSSLKAVFSLEHSLAYGLREKIMENEKLYSDGCQEAISEVAALGTSEEFELLYDQNEGEDEDEYEGESEDKASSYLVIDDFFNLDEKKDIHGGYYYYHYPSFEDLLLEESSKEKEHVLKGTYHIYGFSAVTSSPDNPIRAGSRWDVSFELSQTAIFYEETYADYGVGQSVFWLEGFDLDDGSDKPKLSFYPHGAHVNGQDNQLESEIEIDTEMGKSFDYAAATPMDKKLFPDGYPVPPILKGIGSGADYLYDPNHETCQNESPKITKSKHFDSLAAYCSDEKFRFDIACEPGYGYMKTFPSTVTWTEPAKRIDHYISPVGSNRIYRGNDKISCSKVFPELAKEYGLSEGSADESFAWTVQTKNNEILFFNNSSSCSGFNCPEVYGRFSKKDPAGWNVEPEKNYCIDRWKDHPWDGYIVKLKNLCQNSPVFIKAKERLLQLSKNKAMIEGCSKDPLCKNLVDSLAAIIEKAYLPGAVNKSYLFYRKKMDDAASSNLSFIIERLDPKNVGSGANGANGAGADNAHAYIVSRLYDYDGTLGIISLVQRLKEGIESLSSLFKKTGGDWNSVLSQMTQKTLPPDFSSEEKLRESILGYERSLDGSSLDRPDGSGFRHLLEPKVKRFGCSLEALGRIRVYSDLKIKKIINKPIESSRLSLKLRNIAPVTTD